MTCQNDSWNQLLYFLFCFWHFSKNKKKIFFVKFIFFKNVNQHINKQNCTQWTSFLGGGMGDTKMITYHLILETRTFPFLWIIRVLIWIPAFNVQPLLYLLSGIDSRELHNGDDVIQQLKSYVRVPRLISISNPNHIVFVLKLYMSWPSLIATVYKLNLERDFLIQIWGNESSSAKSKHKISNVLNSHLNSRVK